MRNPADDGIFDLDPAGDDTPEEEAPEAPPSRQESILLVNELQGEEGVDSTLYTEDPPPETEEGPDEDTTVEGEVVYHYDEPEEREDDLPFVLVERDEDAVIGREIFVQRVEQFSVALIAAGQPGDFKDILEIAIGHADMLGRWEDAYMEEIR